MSKISKIVLLVAVLNGIVLTSLADRGVGKNKKKMLGRPLFTWVLAEAIFSNLDQVYVFTDDDEINYIPPSGVAVQTGTGTIDMLGMLRNRVLAAWQQIEKDNGIYLENQEQK